MKKVGVVILVVIVALCAFGGYALKGLKPPTANKADTGPTTVKRGDIDVTAVETGTINAHKVVELKSLVSGRLKKLFVEEGDHVKSGQLIAIVDPRETQLQVDQNRAQVKGAQSVVDKADVDIAQRKLTVKSDLASAEAKMREALVAAQAQPKLTDSSIAEAQANLDSARKEKERLSENAHPNERTASVNAINEAKANLENAQRQYDRDTNLLAKGYVSQKVVDDDKLQLSLAKTRMQTANDNNDKLEAGLAAEMAKADAAINQCQAALDNAMANRIQDRLKKQEYLSAVADRDHAIAALKDIASMEAGRRQSEASVQQLTSLLRDGERNLSETEIRSPIDGIVTKKEIQEGELVASLSSFSSGSPIVRIEDRRSMKVALDINEIDVARMTIGMPATITVDALPNDNFTGKVSKISPSSTALDTASSSGSSSSASTTSDSVVKYSVEIEVENPNDKLRSGMSAKCSLSLVHKPNVLFAPLEFIGREKDGSTYVMVMPPGPVDPKKPATPERKAVKTGTDNGSNIEIVSGVNEGDTLARPDFKGPQRKGAMQMGGDDQ